MEKGMRLKENYSNKIVYSNEDIFETIEKTLQENKTSLIIVPHVCNNIGVFGGGFTKCINDNYPIVQENFCLLGKQAFLGYTQFVTVKTNSKTNSKIVFANMIAQNGIISKKNSRPINYAALVKTMVEVKKFIDTENKNNDIDTSMIHAPKFGSGLAGGNWIFISQLIEDIWHSIPTYIYSYK